MTFESRSGRHKRQKEKSHVRNNSMNAQDSRSPEVQVALTRSGRKMAHNGSRGGQGVAERGTDNTYASLKPKEEQDQGAG